MNLSIAWALNINDTISQPLTAVDATVLSINFVFVLIVGFAVGKFWNEYNFFHISIQQYDALSWHWLMLLQLEIVQLEIVQYEASQLIDSTFTSMNGKFIYGSQFVTCQVIKMKRLNF